VANNSKQKIIDAAITVFSEKGKHGTRMEEIARHAGVNKAMVYYYFGDRETVYREVLKTIFTMTFKEIGRNFDYVLHELSDPVERIQFMSRLYSRIIIEHHSKYRILIEALSDRSNLIPSIIREIRSEVPEFDPQKFAAILQDGINKKVFRDIPFGHFINAFIGLQLSFFIIRPIFTTFMDMSDQEQQSFLQERGGVIHDILLNGILERRARK